MIDRQKLSAQKARGEKAKALRDDQFFKDLIEELKQTAFADFSDADPTDTKRLSRAKLALIGVTMFENKIMSMIVNGQAAEKALAEDRKE